MMEPSVLARNIFRLLLCRGRTCQIEELADVDALRIDPRSPATYDLLVFGALAFDRAGGKLRSLCTDLPAWRRTPKLIVTMSDDTETMPPWVHLESSVCLRRPFSPAEFETALRDCLRIAQPSS